jgi:hypothetical protein
MAPTFSMRAECRDQVYYSPNLEAGEAGLKGQTTVACSTIFPALGKGSLGRAGVYFAALERGSGHRSLSLSTTAIWRCSYSFGAQIGAILEPTKKAPTQIGGRCRGRTYYTQ